MSNEPLGGFVEALGAFQRDSLYQDTLQYAVACSASLSERFTPEVRRT